MKLREQINSISGFRYVIDELCIHSSVGRRCLMEQEFLTEASDIEVLLSRVEIAISYQAYHLFQAEDGIRDRSRHSC